MKHHEIEFSEFQKWFETVEITYANSTRERKSLSCTLKGNFIVRVYKDIVWQGVQPYSALEAYNNITKELP